MSYFKAEMQQIRFGLKPPQTLLWELTALPQTTELDLRGTTFKGKGGKMEGEGVDIGCPNL